MTNKPSLSISNDIQRKQPSSTRDSDSSGSNRRQRPLRTLLDYSPDESSNNINVEQPCVRPIRPKPPSKCPLLGCFYSEFDIKKGPVIVCQSPPLAMDQDIHLPMSDMQNLLQTTFEDLEFRGEAVGVLSPRNGAGENGDDEDNDDCDDHFPGNDGPHYERDDEDTDESEHEIRTAKPENYESGLDESDQEDDLPQPPTLTTSDVQPPQIATPPGGSLSIFDSTSEFIITGTELTSKIITLSAHSWHVMTRPTMISNSRYERNALLFSVGFLLRRAADPRPFRPLLSKLAVTLQAMEEESCFLTRPEHRPKLQTLLERVLLSLNSPEYECNLLLSPSNALHLKLFHIPKPETSPVHDYQVPILLRRDLQLQMYDWDLAINWVILHIDGITNARQISVKAEVDLEMVLACLRVLKHHGVIALVSPFNYSNRYEVTTKATAVLTGKDSRLLQEALAFCLKRISTGDSQQSPSNAPAPPPNSILPTGNDPPESSQPTPFGGGSSFSLFGLTPSSSSYPPRTQQQQLAFSQQQQYPGRFGSMTVASSLEQESSAAGLDPKVHQELRWFKSALAELYCACSRTLSFGDLWLTLTGSDDEEDEEDDDEALRRSSSPWTVANLQDFSPPPVPTRVVSKNKRSVSEDHSDGNGLPADTATTANNRIVSGSSSLVVDTLTHHLESLRRCRSRHRSPSVSSPPESSSVYGGDWNDFFDRIDHRRFATFGLLHCWIVRIHCYPCFPYPFPPAPTSSTIVFTVAADDAFSSTMITTMMNDYDLARMAASMMDGTRCDDELACALETPIGKLVELVEKYGRHAVICLYAE